MLNVLASFSEFERDLAASRIAESRAHLKAHGRRIAGATPFGYFADRHTKQLVVCDEEAAAVARMFRWADAGVTPAVIASFGLTTKEQAGFVKEAVRSVVYDADSRMLKINRIEPPGNGGGAARRSD